MSITWVTLPVVNQENGHIINIKVSSYKKNTSYNRKAGMLSCLVISNFPVFKIKKKKRERNRYVTG